MPNVSVTSGVTLIQGSRSILPHQANQFSPIKPLIVDIGSGSIFIIGGSLGVFSIATIPVDIVASSITLAISSVSVYNSSIATYYTPAVTTILNNVTVSTVGSILINTAELQSLNMEIAFIAAGSIEFSFTGYQTIASIATSTILTTGWLSSGVIAGVTMSSPSANTALGQQTMIVWNSTLATSVSAILTQTK